MAKSKIFTNRHGKKTRVRQTIVAPLKSKPKEKASKPGLPKFPKKKFKFPKLKISKKVWLLLLLVLGLLATVMLLTADSVKRDYERQASLMKRTVIDQSKQSFADQTSARQQVERLKQALSASTDCRVSSLDVVSWYGPARDARHKCQSTAEKYRNLQANLDDMEQLIIYADVITEALKTAQASPPADEFAVIDEYLARWQVAVEELEKIDPPQTLQSAHAKLIQGSRSLSGAWQTLQEANSGQKRDAFNEAEKNLKDQYDAYRSLADDFDMVAQVIQSSISRYSQELAED